MLDIKADRSDIKSQGIAAFTVCSIYPCNKDLHPAPRSSGSGGQAQGRPQECASSPGYG